MAKQPTVIKFTENQKHKLIVGHGVTADGISFDPDTKEVTLINPKSRAAFRLNKQQAKDMSDKLGDDIVGISIDPQTFSVDLLRAKDVGTAMWGEYAADY